MPYVIYTLIFIILISGISTSTKDWSRFYFKTASGLRGKSQHSVALKRSETHEDRKFFLPVISPYILCLHNFINYLERGAKATCAQKRHDCNLQEGYYDMDSISIMLFLHKNMFFFSKENPAAMAHEKSEKFFDDVLNFFAVFLISQEMTHHKLLPHQPEFYFQINIFWWRYSLLVFHF